MAYFQVTLNMGRTDTVTVEADTLIDVKTFFQSVSVATITSIKKIVYSKDLGIGTAVTTYTPNNQNKFMNILVRTQKGYTGTLNISFSIKSLSKDVIIKSVKKNLLLFDDNIVDVLNIIVND